MPSSVGSHATSSLDPIVGNTAAGSIPMTPYQWAMASIAAARRAGVPCVAG
jgi:hypothetical protein